MSGRACLLRVVLLTAVLWSIGRSNIDDICKAHEAGRNCSVLKHTHSLPAPEQLGCASVHSAYTAAMLSGAAYLDWDKMVTDHEELPLTIPFEFGPCWVKSTNKVPSSSKGKLLKRLAVAFRNALVSVGSMIPFRLIAPIIGSKHPLSLVRSVINAAFNILNKVVNLIRGDTSWHKEKRHLSPAQKHDHFRMSQNEIAPTWFFSDWKDGYWHDTEVLIASSSTAMYVVFRGSDSPADAVTSSQTYIPARHVARFPKVDVGSFHRGILNAYSRVNTGKISYLKESIEGWEEDNPFLAVFYNTFRRCKGVSNQTLLDSDHTQPPSAPAEQDLESSIFFRGSRCRVKINLADVLSKAVTAGIQAGVKVVISGHSLGGGLATMLTLDVLLNNLDPTRIYRDDVTDPDRKASYNWVYNSDNSQPLDLLIDEVPANNLYLLTYGDPEVADAFLFDHLLQEYPHISKFAKRNHMRFVSVSMFPYCKFDVVTGSMTLANSIFGDIVMGKGGGFWGRVKAREKQRTAQMSQYKHDHTSKKGGSHDKLSLNYGSDCSSGVVISSLREAAFPSVDTARHAVGSDTQGYLHEPIYVSSGHAASQFAAHSVIHYIQGLTRALNSNGALGCDFSYVPQYFKESMSFDTLNFTLSQENNCNRCYMACGLPASILNKVFYSSGGCRIYDNEGTFFTLVC